MLYLMTNHHKTDKWMNIQSQYIKKNTSVDYVVLCSVTDIDINSIKDNLSLRHTKVVDISYVENKHYVKMNKLIQILEAKEAPKDSDIIVFIDPDAFPVNDNWYEILNKKLQSYPFVAISREENIEPL